MPTSAPRSVFFDLLRCVQPNGGGACGGSLTPDGDDHLRCGRCAVRYPMVQGVPILKPDPPGGDDDRWFETMYEGRSRTEDLQTDYLRGEREFVAALVAERGVTGPSLEVGCGTGFFAEILPGFVGLEYSLQSLLASGFAFADRVCGDATSLPFGAGSMECVATFNVLEHVENVDRTFGEMDRVLRPGGVLILKPAWHCTRYTTELIPVRPYGELNLRQKLVKALLPVLRSKPYKIATWVPWRLVRRATARRDNPLRWRRLTPYHGESWISDADAVASLDCHEGILYFTSRGYACPSHPTAARQLLAGQDTVVLVKPGPDGAK